MMRLKGDSKGDTVLGRLETLESAMRDAFGENMGTYLLEAELGRLRKEKYQLTADDMDSLVKGLRVSISPMIGEKVCNDILSFA